MQTQTVYTKLSSFGKGRESDQANARYISRFGTLQDEMGNSITPKQRNEAVNIRLDLVPNLDKSSFRVIVVLPMERTDDARKITEDVMREKYGAWLAAYHDTNDKKERQPHQHFLVFNDCKNHPLKELQEIHLLRNELTKRFNDAGLNFSFSNAANNLKPKRTQCEIHMKERGKQVWKDDIRQAVSASLSASTDFDSFVSALSQHGITISRETANSLTFTDSEGRPCRLNKLFSDMKNRADLEHYINNRISKQQSSIDRLRQAEQLFCNRLTKTAEVLSFQGARKEEIHDRINTILNHRATSDAISDRWEALKRMKIETDKIMTREQLRNAKQQMYQQHQIKRHQSKMLKKSLMAGNPIAAFVAGIAYIINAIATRHGDINRDGLVETREQELLKDVLKQPKPKQPTPEPIKPAPGR